MGKCRTGENVRQMFSDNLIGLKGFRRHIVWLNARNYLELRRWRQAKCDVVWMTIQVDDSHIEWVESRTHAASHKRAVYPSPTNACPLHHYLSGSSRDFIGRPGHSR